MAEHQKGAGPCVRESRMGPSWQGEALLQDLERRLIKATAGEMAALRQDWGRENLICFLSRPENQGAHQVSCSSTLKQPGLRVRGAGHGTQWPTAEVCWRLGTGWHGDREQAHYSESPLNKSFACWTTSFSLRYYTRAHDEHTSTPQYPQCP